jgi:hypothetical protein
LSWGTLKPQLIHAVSNMSVTPLTFSLMYFNPDKLKDLHDLRYRVNTRPNSSVVYNYLIHNGLDLAVQNIFDPEIPINMTNNYFKTI